MQYMDDVFKRLKEEAEKACAVPPITTIEGPMVPPGLGITA